MQGKKKMEAEGRVELEYNSNERYLIVTAQWGAKVP